MTPRWSYGDVVERREVLGLSPVAQVEGPAPAWLGQAWMIAPVHVVEDTDDALVTYIPPGAEFAFPPGDWPIPGGVHPWAEGRTWYGHGTLMVQRPGEHHAVWHFWSGPQREFTGWYINLQTAFMRTRRGYDTQDLELDIVVSPDGEWIVKDQDVLHDRITDGRFSPPMVEWIESIGAGLTARLAAGEPLWDPKWAHWVPDDSWRGTRLPSAS